MIRSLYSSSSGMQAQQMNLDVIANNLANVNTTGFKKSRVEFEDLVYQVFEDGRVFQVLGDRREIAGTARPLEHGARRVALVVAHDEADGDLEGAVGRAGGIHDRDDRIGVVVDAQAAIALAHRGSARGTSRSSARASTTTG